MAPVRERSCEMSMPFSPSEPVTTARSYSLPSRVSRAGLATVSAAGFSSTISLVADIAPILFPHRGGRKKRRQVPVAQFGLAQRLAAPHVLLLQAQGDPGAPPKERSEAKLSHRAYSSRSAFTTGMRAARMAGKRPPM